MKMDLVQQTKQCVSFKFRRTVKLNIKTSVVATLFKTKPEACLKSLKSKEIKKEKVHPKKKRVTRYHVADRKKTEKP